MHVSVSMLRGPNVQRLCLLLIFTIICSIQFQNHSRWFKIAKCIHIICSSICFLYCCLENLILSSNFFETFTQGIIMPAAKLWSLFYDSNYGLIMLENHAIKLFRDLSTATGTDQNCKAKSWAITSLLTA